MLGCVSAAIIWMVSWIHFRAPHRELEPRVYRLALGFLGVVLISLTGHLGGFLSGVNGPGQ